MDLLLALVAFPALSELVLILVVLCLIGALFTVLQPYIAEPFRKIIIIIAVFALVLYALRIFGVI